MNKPADDTDEILFERFIVLMQHQNVKSGPSTESAVIGTLERGQEIDVSGDLERRGVHWGKVVLSDGSFGYVCRSLLAPLIARDKR